MQRDNATHLTRCLVSLNAEEPVPRVRRAENVTEGSRVAHILSYERYFVHRVMVQAVLREIDKDI